MQSIWNNENKIEFMAISNSTQMYCIHPILYVAFDPKVKLKREYLDTARANNNFKTKEEGGFHGDPKMPGTDTKKSTLSGHEWYSQQAHRAVNQAIGRVIRNRHDYGAVLLLDSRYSQPVNHQGLSKWLRPHILPDEGVGAAIGSLSKFYRQAETKVKELEQTNKGKVLEFEQEEEDRLRKQKQQRKLEERENAFTKVAFVQNLNRNLKQGKADLKPVSAPKKGDVATGGEQNDTDHPVSFIAPDRVIARVDVTAMATKKEEVFTKQDSAETTVRSTGNESVFNWSRGNQGGGMKSMPSSKPTKKVSKPDSKQVAAQFFKKAQAMLSPQDLASLKKSIVSLKMFGDQKDDKAYLKAARGVINLCSRYEEFFHEQYDKTMLYLFFHLVARPFKRKVELVAMKGLYRSSALGHLCKENLHPESLEKIQTMFPYFLRPLWCSVDEDEEITLDKSKFLKEAQKILAILKVSEQNALTSKMVDAFTSLVPSRFVAATRALVAEMKASQNIRRMKASENSAKKGEDAIDAFRFQKPAAAFKVEGSSEGKPTKQEALQNDNKTEQPSAVKKEPSAKDEKIEATNKPSMKSGSKVTEKSAISTARTTQAFGAKPRTLTSLIGRANAPNQTKEASANDKSKVLSNKRGNSVDSKLGAPPAYSRHSKNISQANSSIPQKKEVVGAKNDAVTEMLVEAESQPYMKKTAGDIVQSLNSNVPANMACVMCHDKAQIPLIGECGHLACKTCWLLWLAKAPVCPICRVAVVKESLARIVFRDDGERQSGAAPTLSQLCED